MVHILEFGIKLEALEHFFPKRNPLVGGSRTKGEGRDIMHDAGGIVAELENKNSDPVSSQRRVVGEL